MKENMPGMGFKTFSSLPSLPKSGSALFLDIPKKRLSNTYSQRLLLIKISQPLETNYFQI